MVFVEGDRYKVNVNGKEFFVQLKKYNVSKLKSSFWWAEAEERILIPGWPKTVSGKSGLLLGQKEDEVEEQLKQNGLVLVVSEWKGGFRIGCSQKKVCSQKKGCSRYRTTRRKQSKLVKRKSKFTHPR